MESNFEFIINAIIKVAKTNRTEGLEAGNIIKIQGTKKGFLKNEEIIISIQRSLKNPDLAAMVTAEVNGNRKSDDVQKEILFDILKRTQMLDSKLNMKLDIVLNQRKMRFENGMLIIE
jgi:hypothetical protein